MSGVHLLSDLVDLHRGYDLPEPERRPGSVPVMGSAGLTGFHDEVRTRGPGIVVGRSGSSFGVVNFSRTDFWPLNTALYVSNFKGNDPRFTYFALKAIDFSGHNSGSAQPSLNRNFISTIRVRIPPLDEQRAIAHILGSLDDKIELNRRLSETLEDTARALFRSWFVDFDPVNAMSRGRVHPLHSELLGLFPNSFEDSRAGSIPKGWTRAPLSEWATALSGGTPSKSDKSLWDGDVPWISPKVMTTIHADEAEDYVTARAIGNGTRIAPTGSTLVMVRGMGLHQEVRVSQALHQVSFNQDVKALVPKAIDSSLLLFAMLNGQADLLRKVESSGHGTGRLPSDLLLSHSITLPRLDVQQRLGSVFATISSRIAEVRAESRSLAALRDSLLPRLIPGELHLGNVRKYVGLLP